MSDAGAVENADGREGPNLLALSALLAGFTVLVFGNGLQNTRLGVDRVCEVSPSP